MLEINGLMAIYLEIFYLLQITEAIAEKQMLDTGNALQSSGLTRASALSDSNRTSNFISKEHWARSTP